MPKIFGYARSSKKDGSQDLSPHAQRERQLERARQLVEAGEGTIVSEKDDFLMENESAGLQTGGQANPAGGRPFCLSVRRLPERREKVPAYPRVLARFGAGRLTRYRGGGYADGGVNLFFWAVCRWPAR